MIRVMVVDDEPLAREELIRIIREDDGFQVIGEAANGREALTRIKELSPDAAFLDIDMPVMTGLEVASQLCEWENPPFVIFATAYHQHALEAFEIHAIDYVLKPYDCSRIRKTLERLKEILASKTSSREKLTSLDDYLIKKGTIKKLVGHARNSKDRIVIHPEEVYYFHARLAEVVASLEKRELLVNATLKEIIQTLDPERYAQTHKAYVVNLDKVEKVSPLFSGNFEITLKAPKSDKVPLSRRYARTIKSLLKTW